MCASGNVYAGLCHVAPIVCATTCVKSPIVCATSCINSNKFGKIRYVPSCSKGVQVLSGSVTDALWDGTEYGLSDGDRQCAWNSTGITNVNLSDGYGATVLVNGGVSVGGQYGSMPIIAVHEDDRFMMTAKIRATAGTSKGYMGSIDYNCAGTNLGGNPGSFGYWTMSNSSYNTNWCRYYGFISGFHASTPGRFEIGTKFWTPQALFNYGCGDDCSYLQEWKVYKINRKAPLELQQPTGQQGSNADQSASYMLKVESCDDSHVTMRNSCGGANNGWGLSVGSGSPWLDFSSGTFDFRSVAYGSEGSWNAGTKRASISSGGAFCATSCVISPVICATTCVRVHNSIQAVNNANLISGPNSSYGCYLVVGGNGNNSSHATVATTNGNLHLDAKPGSGVYLNHYSGYNNAGAVYSCGSFFNCTCIQSPIVCATNYVKATNVLCTVGCARIGKLYIPGSSCTYSGDGAIKIFNPHGGHESTYVDSGNTGQAHLIWKAKAATDAEYTWMLRYSHGGTKGMPQFYCGVYACKCLQTPILCGTNCVRANIVCGSTSVNSPIVCGTNCVRTYDICATRFIWAANDINSSGCIIAAVKSCALSCVISPIVCATSCFEVANTGYFRGACSANGSSDQRAMVLEDGQIIFRTAGDYYHKMWYYDGLAFATNSSHGHFRFYAETNTSRGNTETGATLRFDINAATGWAYACVGFQSPVVCATSCVHAGYVYSAGTVCAAGTTKITSTSYS